MSGEELETNLLIERARQGDNAARADLLDRHRDRLRRMVRVYLDRRLAARLDPSDVIQEALTEAARKLPEYLREPPLPFYPWLRRIAWERLVKIHRRHLNAAVRDATREVPCGLGLPDESAWDLAGRLVATGTSPINRLVRDEMRARVRAALDRLSERDREVLVMRYLEQLSTKEIAEALGATEGAVKVRHLRALERLRGLLVGEFGESES
jgi:RNA polymerase sigma-70 factor (ECF subfamily)